MYCQLFAAFDMMLTVTYNKFLECIVSVCAYPTGFFLDLYFCNEDADLCLGIIHVKGKYLKKCSIVIYIWVQKKQQLLKHEKLEPLQLHMLYEMHMRVNILVWCNTVCDTHKCLC